MPMSQGINTNTCLFLTMFNCFKDRNRLNERRSYFTRNWEVKILFEDDRVLTERYNGSVSSKVCIHMSWDRNMWLVVTWDYCSVVISHTCILFTGTFFPIIRPQVFRLRDWHTFAPPHPSNPPSIIFETIFLFWNVLMSNLVCWLQLVS